MSERVSWVILIVGNSPDGHIRTRGSRFDRLPSVTIRRVQGSDAYGSWDSEIKNVGTCSPVLLPGVSRFDRFPTTCALRRLTELLIILRSEAGSRPLVSLQAEVGGEPIDPDRHVLRPRAAARPGFTDSVRDSMTPLILDL